MTASVETVISNIAPVLQARTGGQLPVPGTQLGINPEPPGASEQVWICILKVYAHATEVVAFSQIVLVAD